MKPYATAQTHDPYDVIIIGAGISGSFMASALTKAGKRCLLLEAGKHYQEDKYPTNEIDANSQLYWSGGIEFNTSADIGFLRPKCVGGGSVVNQALVDRFDDIAFESWKEKSGVEFFNSDDMASWYQKAEESISMQHIPAAYRNGNAKIFEEGFSKNGFHCAPLRRAQKNCRYEDGNDCIECLAGCRIQSKQSTPWTTLAAAQKTGLLTLIPQFEVTHIEESSDGASVTGHSHGKVNSSYLGRKIVLASGAIGNSKLLIRSGFSEKLATIGHGFYTHPQYMNLAIYEQPVEAFRGPFQAFKSDDPEFRKQGFKLENVFAPPVSIAMLIPGFGPKHLEQMRQISHFGCIEVAIRDTEPGRITVNSKGKIIISKSLNTEDMKRREAGLNAVEKIFSSTGAKIQIPGKFGIGLHLMGGCAMGKDPTKSVVGPDFRIHGSKNIFAADSSIFPDAPGINPSLTIMALALKGAQEVLT